MMNVGGFRRVGPVGASSTLSDETRRPYVFLCAPRNRAARLRSDRRLLRGGVNRPASIGSLRAARSANISLLI
jgi:hypothetical protein